MKKRVDKSKSKNTSLEHNDVVLVEKFNVEPPHSLQKSIRISGVDIERITFPKSNKMRINHYYPTKSINTETANFDDPTGGTKLNIYNFIEKRKKARIDNPFYIPGHYTVFNKSDKEIVLNISSEDVLKYASRKEIITKIRDNRKNKNK